MRLDEMDGMYVGLLNDDERAEFEQAIKDGRAQRLYEGMGGFLGMPKVKLIYELKHRRD